RHPFAVFFLNHVNNVEIVVDLGCAEIQSRSLLATDCFVPFELWRSQFRGHGLQRLHGFCDPRVCLSVADTRRQHSCCYETSSGENTDKSEISIHCGLPVQMRIGQRPIADGTKSK